MTSYEEQTIRYDIQSSPETGDAHITKLAALKLLEEINSLHRENKNIAYQLECMKQNFLDS